ncbi:formin-like protein 20 [Drosophila guanche]|uniref:formin-like protein 20 n=1 Tax=Drosophila guanche TaxID=7266 RepID=UPI001471EDF9|nr:formin-like protein 20 [Drosophila guanche]
MPSSSSSASSSKQCCGNGSSQMPPPATGCCQDCRCCKQSYEHLPVPRLQHQQPPPPLFQAQQRSGTQPPQQQVSCITTLQQTTTTQQMQQLPAAAAPGYGYGNCLVPHVPEATTTTSSNTYVSNALPEHTGHCHSNCRGIESNSHHAPPPAQPMILLPFMMPMQQQQQQHMAYPPPCAQPEDFKPVFHGKPAPPPPQPPPPIRSYQQMLQPTLPLPLPGYQMGLPYQKAIPAPMSTPPPPPPPRSVQTLKTVAATAIDAYQRVSLPRLFVVNQQHLVNGRSDPLDSDLGAVKCCNLLGQCHTDTKYLWACAGSTAKLQFT